MIPFLAGGAAAVASAAILATGSYYMGYNKAEEAVRKEWAADSAKALAAIATANARTVEAERRAVDELTKLRREKDAKIKATNASYDALVKRLRNRANSPAISRASSVPKSGDSSVGACSGERLSERDSLFLAELARDAQNIQAEYVRCRKAYEAAVKVTTPASQ